MHPGHIGFTLLHELTVPEHHIWRSVRSCGVCPAIDKFTYGPSNAQHKPGSPDKYNLVHRGTAGLVCSRYMRAIARTQIIYTGKVIVI